MGAVATMDMFRANRSRTGGELPLNGGLAWITLALVLLCGASLEYAAQGTQHVNYLETTYGVQVATDR
jgi:hypothetical protein